MAVSQGALPTTSDEGLSYDPELVRALGSLDHVCAHSARPRPPRVRAGTNDSLDLHEITAVVAVALGESENGADERG